MPYIAHQLDRFIGVSVGSGQCVAFVEVSAHTPHTTKWIQGAKVEHNHSIQAGTAIATFQKFRYSNNNFGLSHAAIYLKQTHDGIYVLDQWNHNGKRQAVHERLIHFRHGIGKLVNDGNAYYVIESENIDIAHKTKP